MSLASVFAKTIVKASDNVFDAQKVKTQIKHQLRVLMRPFLLQATTKLSTLRKLYAL